MDDFKEECTIALVGKYIKISDAYASLNKALQHAAIHSKRRLVLKVSTPKCWQKATSHAGNRTRAAWVKTTNPNH